MALEYIFDPQDVSRSLQAHSYLRERLEDPKKRKKRKKKGFDAKHELGVGSSEKQLNGLVLKKVEFLDVPFSKEHKEELGQKWRL